MRRGCLLISASARYVRIISSLDMVVRGSVMNARMKRRGPVKQTKAIVITDIVSVGLGLALDDVINS